MIYKFVSHETKIENIKNSIAYECYQKLKEVGSYAKLSKEYKEKLNICFSELWHYETYKTGKYKIMGYIIDFSEWQKTFYVKTKYHGIREIKSFNKTFLINNATSKSGIIYIVEV